MRTRVVASVTVVLLAAGCGEPGSSILSPSDAGVSQVRDGANNGVAGFYFLPPLVPAPTYDGVFDGTLAPVVTICAWSGEACLLPLLAEFTTTTGQGSEVVRADLEEELYIVNWHTRRFTVQEGQVYRIRVLLEVTELGSADVALSSSGQGTGTAGGVIAVKNGRTLPIKFRIEEGALDAARMAVMGSSTVPIPRADACGHSFGRTCESLEGNVVTDAMRGAYGADFAIMISGALRADLTCPTADLPNDFCPAFTPPPYPITRGQVFAVMPFGQRVVTLTVDGAELKAMLEHGVSQMPTAAGRFPQVSGLCFTYAVDQAAGSRVTSAVRQAADGTCTGAALDLTTSATYTLAIVDFMAEGGDGYPIVGTPPAVQDRLDQVVADFIAGLGTVSPAIQGRIACTTAGTPACPVVTP